MTESTTKKRLSEIEIQLTPQEWAIRFVDEMRKYPSGTAFLKTMAKGTTRDSLMFQPFLMLTEQAEGRFSGKKPEDIRARNHLSRKLQTDWVILNRLIFTVNEKTDNKIESIGLITALKLSTLQIFILQDALGQTAGKTTEWIEKYKTTNDDENNRQIMLKELATFRDVNVGETFSLPPEPHIPTCFPGSIENWVQDITMLISDIFTHEAAINVIQDKYFDGHPILFQDTETRLVETIKTLKDGVATFNEYLKIRETFLKDERDQEDCIISAIPSDRKGQLDIDIEAIKLCAVAQNATELANAWVKFEREKAIADFLIETGKHETYIWEKFRETFGLSS